MIFHTVKYPVILQYNCTVTPVLKLHNHLKLEYVSKDSRNLSTASNTNWYCSRPVNEIVTQRVHEWFEWWGILTTVRTRPGFWIRWAFTTWNTSTTLSVLQRSMVVAMAQNMPDLLTVSLERDTGSSCVGSDGCWPAVDHNGFVVSPTLHLVDLLYHSDDGLWTGALALGVPV